MAANPGLTKKCFDKKNHTKNPAKNFGPLFLQDLVVKSVVSGLEEMRVDWQKSGCNSRYNSYKLLGEKKNRDNLRPWHQVTTSYLTAT